MDGLRTTALDVEALARTPMLAGVSRVDLESLARRAVRRAFRKGTFIIRQGRQGTTLYLLASGRVKVSLASHDGRELVLDHLEAPAHFGQAVIVDGSHEVADIVALTDVEALTLEASDLASAIHEKPRLALCLIASLSCQIRDMTARLEDLAFNDASHRVMRVVLNVATARFEAEGLPLVKGMTHYDIAALAATSRETASRIISRLAKDGILASRGRILVVDLDALRERLGGC